MQLNELTAICPIDGRYGKKTIPLREYFSEYGLIKYRVQVELAWFCLLAEQATINELPPLSDSDRAFIQKLGDDFSVEDAARVKELEATTNHDVKAVEYFIKERFATRPSLAPVLEFVHFACTSEDINNLAYGLMLKGARDQVLLPEMARIITMLETFAHEHANLPMLSRTHGQTATPTTLGKEFANFVYRLRHQYNTLQQLPIRGKINGAVGNFNAHVVTYPNVLWLHLSQTLVESLGLTWNPYTTQIENHDYLAEIFAAITRFNSILVDLCRDTWGYISLGYFKQNLVAGEVGSSTMPHKVNPIDFENAEGNALFANSLLSFLGQQLPTSRWQRDLVDSTLMRNVGLGLSYSYLAFQSLLKGLHKLRVHPEAITEDLAERWELLAEPLQTVMRRYGVKNAYEQLKALTRGQIITEQDVHQFIDQLEIPATAKEALKQLTPLCYIGLAAELAKRI